jgi:magnesium-protoporphyrin O-methyltransferase
LRDQILKIGAGATLLDVGAGIGAVSFELLASGYTEAVCVDLSPAYLRAARSEINRRGLDARMSVIEGDLTQAAGRIPESDTVVMDRVVCCYPHFQSLLETGLRHSKRLLAFSYPQDRWYVRLVIAIENLRRRMGGDPFRAFTHSPAAMERLITSAGFRRLARSRTLAWCIDVYQRTGS